MYDAHYHIDGIWYRPRLTGEDWVAIFDRAAARLTVADPGDLPGQPGLPAVLPAHAIVVER